MDNEKKQSELKKEKLIAYLIHCIDQEYKKPLEEIDMDYIDECVEFLLDLQGIDATLTPEVIKEKVSEISKEWIEEENCNEKLDKGENKKKSKKKIKKHVTVKRIWLIAACIGLLVALFALASVAFEWSFFDDIIEKFGSVSQAPESEWFEVNGESVKKYSGNRLYDSIDEAKENERSDVLYPALLPDNIKITNLSFYYDQGYERLSYVFDDNKISCQITFDSQIEEQYKEDATECVVINEMPCYIYDMIDVGCVQIYFEYQGNTYEYTYNDKQILINIIENLEEVQ